MKLITLDGFKDVLFKIKNKLPVRLGQLTNDAGFMTSSDLAVTQVKTSGTEIAKIDGKSIYATTPTVSANWSSGTLIATVNGVKIYKPNKSTTTKQYTFVGSNHGQWPDTGKTQTITLANGIAKSCSLNRIEALYVDSGSNK